MYKLLIVDDEKKIATSIEMMVDWKKFDIEQIEICNSYKDALFKSDIFKPDIVICDVQLNDGWGYDLIQAFNKANIKSSFIMISGYDQFEYVKKSLLAGAKEYLLKPIDKDKLVEAIKKIIRSDLNGLVNEIWDSKDTIDNISGLAFSSYSSVTNKILTVIKRDYGENISLTTIADIFMMNSKYLGRIFLKDTSLKFSDYLFLFRMATAKNLITTTNYKIQDIAAQVGFPHINHFYTSFKSYYNVSPNDLRQHQKSEEQQL